MSDKKFPFRTKLQTDGRNIDVIEEKLWPDWWIEEFISLSEHQALLEQAMSDERVRCLDSALWTQKELLRENKIMSQALNDLFYIDTYCGPYILPEMKRICATALNECNRDPLVENQL